jgi:hypothetical protein
MIPESWRIVNFVDGGNITSTANEVTARRMLTSVAGTLKASGLICTALFSPIQQPASLCESVQNDRRSEGRKHPLLQLDK